jgi:hypothetical protein
MVLNKKALTQIAKGLDSTGLFLAPRPGLEPGTYGLTESQARKKLIQINDLYVFLITV